MRKCNQQKKALRHVRIRKMKLRIRTQKMKKLQHSGVRSAKAQMSRINWLLNKIKEEKTVK